MRISERALRNFHFLTEELQRSVAAIINDNSPASLLRAAAEESAAAQRLRGLVDLEFQSKLLRDPGSSYGNQESNTAGQMSESAAPSTPSALKNEAYAEVSASACNASACNTNAYAELLACAAVFSVTEVGYLVRADEQTNTFVVRTAGGQRMVPASAPVAAVRFDPSFTYWIGFEHNIGFLCDRQGYERVAQTGRLGGFCQLN